MGGGGGGSILRTRGIGPRPRLGTVGLRADPGSPHRVVPGDDSDRSARQGPPAARPLKQWVLASQDPLDGLLASCRGGGARAAQFPGAPVAPRTALGASDDGEVTIGANKRVPQTGKGRGVFGHPFACAPLVLAVGGDTSCRDKVVAQAASPRTRSVAPQVLLGIPRLGLRDRPGGSGHARWVPGEVLHGRRHSSDDQRGPPGVEFDVRRNRRVGGRVEGGGFLGGLVRGGVALYVGGVARRVPVPCHAVGFGPPHRHTPAFGRVGQG